MDLLEFLNAYFTAATMARLIEANQRKEGTVFSRVFRQRSNWPLARISMGEITEKTGSVAVTARGAAALPMGKERTAITSIEPMPIRLSKFLTGADINDLKVIFGTGDDKGQRAATAYLDRLVNNLMLRTQATRDALCAQAITGKIDYQMKTDAGLERYQVSYGTGRTSSYNISNKWNAEGVKIGTVYKDLVGMQKVLNEAGFSGTVSFLAGLNVFATLSDLISSIPNDQRFGAKVNDDGSIQIGSYKIYPAVDTYNDTDANGAATTPYEVGANKIVGYIEDLAELVYCAVDDLDGNLEASPFFSKYEKKTDPSGYKVISESKPMPLVSAESFVWGTACN